MKRLFVCVSALFCALSICAGPHTIQRGETFADVARLYNISLDTLIIANSNADAFVGLTIEVPLSTLLIDLGDSELFRYLSKNSFSNREKGIRKYKQAYEKQLRLKDTQVKNRLKIESQIESGYKEAVQCGNIDALYELGRHYIHGTYYSTVGYPNFSQTVNPNFDEFKKGLEYLQIASIIGKNDKALIEMVLACGYKESPIHNPYLCLSMLEQYQEELGIDLNALICYMYETGYGINPNLLQAYIHCPNTELTSENGNQTHRERILKEIESMPIGFESSRYGVGLDSKIMLSIGLSYYHNDKLEPEGLFWLHRAARLNNVDANWILATILQNGNYVEGSAGSPSKKESQVLCFAKNAAANGKKEAKDYLDAYENQKRAEAERARRIAYERQRLEDEKKQRRRQMWTNVAGAVFQAAAQTFVAVETAKMQTYRMPMSGSFSNGSPIGQMSDAQWQAKNQLALQQIMQYTVNKSIADWTGTPMVPTDMSAVDLGTDMSPGSPLWNWTMQQQIHTMETQNAKMGFEVLSFYRRQTEQITRQLMENPSQPIAGYVDQDGNWISYEMVAAGNDNSDDATNSNVHEPKRSRVKEYYEERYGDVDCYLCKGTGDCSSCEGRGYIWGIGMTKLKCPNCLEINGCPSGKCSKCKGTGLVYGLK